MRGGAKCQKGVFECLQKNFKGLFLLKYPQIHFFTSVIPLTSAEKIIEPLDSSLIFWVGCLSSSLA